MADATLEGSSKVSSEPSRNVSSSVIPTVGENHSLQITQHKLNGANFLEWSQSVMLVIRGKGKLDYLTGTKVTLKEGATGHSTWESENSMVMAWLINSMKPKIGRTYLFYKTAKEIWDMAHEMYSNLKNSAQCFEVRSALRSTKQGNLSMIEYFNTFTKLWQEMDMFYETNWHCPEDSLKYKQMLEKERVFDFLHGLSKDLDEVRGGLLGTKPFPNIREAFAEVRREESRKRAMLRMTTEVISDNWSQSSALVSKKHEPANSSDQRGNRKNDKAWCDHCQRPYHTRETCWKTHGKPANWKARKQGEQSRVFQAVAEETRLEDQFLARNSLNNYKSLPNTELVHKFQLQIVL
ncbi:PREDICTED: uncharacterized protein LOC18592547 [Theobroma cacao]|uniref:Uncharacterized protein LOC18592547 n=1 Tax=Theobroma cacao TaxID=3641 RepID=A0AB32WVM4_THECC|nr:PREDICTED: uncharacterized protein LOC18592547 [Theobroma cacao]